jgi:hypothetical protein
MVMDLDSTICLVCGKAKGGAGYGHIHVLSYHPSSPRGPTPARCSTPACAGAGPTPDAASSASSKSWSPVRQAGATGDLIMRFDSGFWSNRTLATLERLDIGFTTDVRMIKSVVSSGATSPSSPTSKAPRRHRRLSP